ncbi:MAG: cytidine deaminase [Alistipes sp.]|jgi:cytidine deaminase|nr:cytidine deaminase [Alistipes sp.]
MIKKLSFDYESYASRAAMTAGDRALADRAAGACSSAHAPYSRFRVGAAARLRSGLVITGSNQESEVFPAGICAERTLLFHWGAHHSGSDGSPADPIEALAIASVPGERECYPCGQCRQVLLDTERRQGSPIRIIMCGTESASVVASAADLLPFQFSL